MSEPRRTGLMNLLGTSTGCQFVIPVYQRNYTWTAEKDVKQLLSDLKHVLKDDYKNHFLGILIYLEKSIDFSTREFQIIDGQQRLTTTFLIIYALKSLLKENGENERVNQLEDQFLTNPHHSDKIKYRLKPLVSDDDVYRCIIEERFNDIENKDSRILKNYNYILDCLKKLIGEGYTPNDILMALDKLYVVCVPISEEDNAQKIFESINATGVKLTSADLIRNYLLMNLESDLQDNYYANYWKKIEDNVSSDSSELELFFRMFIAVKSYELVAKNAVYRCFVEYVETHPADSETLFRELLDYSKIYNYLNKKPINEIEDKLTAVITDFRKLGSDLPMSIIMEFIKLRNNNNIDNDSLAMLIGSINTYLIRRSICDINSQNISRLFPTLLKKIIESSRITDEDDSSVSYDYSDTVTLLNQEMVGNTVDTSGSYMPTDAQMHEMLHNANVYKRPALRIALDRVELLNNPAPVDLSRLSVEHLMPQTPTQEWYDALGVDEETYFANLHRIGNLTLAAVPDNTVMSNNIWEFKNEVLRGTNHIKLNTELFGIEKWMISNIESRSTELINAICSAFPYPNVKPIRSSSSEITEKAAREMVVNKLLSGYVEIKKNASYSSSDKKYGYVLVPSKAYPQNEKVKYWFAYREKRMEPIQDCEEQYFTLICRSSSIVVVRLPLEFINNHIDNFNQTVEDEDTSHYHIVVFVYPDGKVTLLVSRPELKEIDMTPYVVGRYSVD